LEGKKTESNQTEINQFEPVFGSVPFKKLKKNISFWLFILVQNRTEPEMLSPVRCYARATSWACDMLCVVMDL
jgi:hypothetical protein